MSEVINGDQDNHGQGEAKHVKNAQEQDEGSQSSGSSSSGESGSSSSSDSESNDGQKGNQPDHDESQQEVWKQAQEGSSKGFNGNYQGMDQQEEKKSQRGNGGFNDNTFQNFNPKFNAGGDEDQEEETRDQYRNPGRGGGRGGRGGGRGGFSSGDRGGYNDRGFGDRDRGGSRGRGRGGGDRGFNDRGFDDRGGRGGRGGGRGGRGGFGGRDNGFGNRDQNSSFGNQREGQGFNQNFQNQNELRSSKSSGGMNNMGQGSNNMHNSQAMQGQLQQFQNLAQNMQGQVPPGMFPANYFPFIASDPQAAFKKKPGYSEEEKLTSSKVSKASKASKATKKDKKKRKKSVSSSSSSSDSDSSSSDESSDALNMSLFQTAGQHDDSIIHTLDELKKKQKQKRSDKKRFEVLTPQGRKDWPSARLYVLGNIFEITFRNITEHSDCVLVIPYEDTSMNLYPGTIVNKSEIDYRDKLEQKKDILTPGSVYTQDNLLSKEFLYHCIAFTKIDKEPETIDNALKHIFDTVERLQKKFKHLKHLVIPLSIFVHHPDKYPRFIKKVTTLMESKKFKSVSLTTKSKEEWERAMQAFIENTSEMIKKNEIGI